MKFHLHAAQYVALRRGRISFEEEGRHAMCLSQQQFYNLGDILITLDHLDLHAYPLDDQAWLHVRREGVALANPYGHFWFHPESWVVYKKRLHPVIHFILLHGRRERHQHDENHVRRWRARSRRAARHTRRQTLSRASSHAPTYHEQRAQRPTVSSRYSSNSRSRQRARSTRHASRTSSLSSDQHNE